jgi:hypothetical protein
MTGAEIHSRTQELGCATALHLAARASAMSAASEMQAMAERQAQESRAIFERARQEHAAQSGIAACARAQELMAAPTALHHAARASAQAQEFLETSERARQDALDTRLAVLLVVIAQHVSSLTVASRRCYRAHAHRSAGKNAGEGGGDGDGDGAGSTSRRDPLPLYPLLQNFTPSQSIAKLTPGARAGSALPFLPGAAPFSRSFDHA